MVHINKKPAKHVKLWLKPKCSDFEWPSWTACQMPRTQVLHEFFEDFCTNTNHLNSSMSLSAYILRHQFDTIYITEKMTRNYYRFLCYLFTFLKSTERALIVYYLPVLINQAYDCARFFFNIPWSLKLEAIFFQSLNNIFM